MSLRNTHYSELLSAARQGAKAATLWVQHSMNEWWAKGAALWAIGLGFLTLFLWVPAIHLVSLGLGNWGARAWDGLLNLWPHPAWNFWAAKVEQWAEALTPNGALMAEGWLFAFGLVTVFGIFAAIPGTVVWQTKRLNASTLGVTLLLASAMVLGPLGIGAVFANLVDQAGWMVACGVALSVAVLTLGTICLQLLQVERLRNWASFAGGACVAMVLGAAVFTLSYQLAWFGWFAGLPMVQMSFLGLVFSCAWGGALSGLFLAAGKENADTFAQDLDSARPGDRVAFALDILKYFERLGSLSSSVSVDALSQEMGVPSPQIANVLSRLHRFGLVNLTLGRLGSVQAKWEVDPTEIELFDVVQAMGGGLDFEDEHAENGLIYAATVQRHALNITLFDYFHHRGKNASHFSPDSLTLLRSNSVEPLAPFESNFWEEVDLAAVSGLEPDDEQNSEIVDFPPPEKRAS